MLKEKTDRLLEKLKKGILLGNYILPIWKQLLKLKFSVEILNNIQRQNVIKENKYLLLPEFEVRTVS